MNIENGFDLIVGVLFTNIPQLGGIGNKSQGLVISFCLVEV